MEVRIAFLLKHAQWLEAFQIEGVSVLIETENIHYINICIILLSKHSRKISFTPQNSFFILILLRIVAQNFLIGIGWSWGYYNACPLEFGGSRYPLCVSWNGGLFFQHFFFYAFGLKI